VRYPLALITASALLLSPGCGSPDRAPVVGIAASADSSQEPINVYAATGPDGLSDVVKEFPDRVYVPNSGDNAVDVIDPHTFTIVDHFRVGLQPQHVVPSYDLKTLWVVNDLDDSLTRIDPATGRKLGTVKVEDPYNMYYTPDGRFAIIVAERLHRLDFRDAVSLKLVESVRVPCRGVDHMDFAHTGQYLIATCEFSGDLVKVDLATRTVMGTLKLSEKAMPQDIRLSPDGRVFYVADMMGNGVYVIDGDRFETMAFIATGKGTHGLYPSRDAKFIYVSNRGEGTISLLDTSTRTITTKWVIPGGGSPDMGGVSTDGKVLWLSGRYHSEVYAIDTQDGHLLARIKVGKGPHGLCLYPQPGRYSLGHTGNMR
jgi:DNA-binding beta-propeller fold protein YncE